MKVGEQMVICIPDVCIHKRSKADEFLLIACDGVFDVMDNQQAVSLVAAIADEIGEDEEARGLYYCIF